MVVPIGPLELLKAVLQLDEVLGRRKHILVLEVLPNLLGDLVADELLGVEVHAVEVDEGLRTVMQTLTHELGLADAGVAEHKHVGSLG